MNRIRERLWVKPLIICVLSILAAVFARAADHLGVTAIVPEINSGSIETLLTIISSSMLVIAVFAVGSMLSAYASASNSATPRSFSLVVADDVSQNALSTFIGAFIFSIVALVALMNGYFEKAGRFFLFLITIVVFAVVIINFLRWVDRIARLGRLGTTIDKVERVTAAALQRRRKAPRFGAQKASGRKRGVAIYADAVGYVQQIDVSALQSIAENHDCDIRVTSLPGTFVGPREPLAYVCAGKTSASDEIDAAGITKAFLIGDDRTFDDDPRFGLIVLAEIASRALSPAVNDPGTAIDIIGTFVRLFALWSDAGATEKAPAVEFDRVAIPALALNDMFDDAFNPIARDGAGTIEVAIRLQKAFRALASQGDEHMRDVAAQHARLALRHAEKALKLPEEIAVLRAVSGFSNRPGNQ